MEQGDTVLPQPGVGLDLGGLRPGGAIGGAVMDERTSLGAGGRCRDVLFWELGLCWPLSQLQHLGRGLGVLIPSQKGEGGSGHAACRRQGGSREPVESKLEPCAGQGSYLTLQCGQGKDWSGALGEHRGEQALVLQHQERRQQLRPPKQLCSEVVGRNNTPGGTPQSSHSLQLASPSCHLELQVTGRGHTAQEGSQWFGDPVLLGSCPPLLCKAQLWGSPALSA